MDGMTFFQATIFQNLLCCNGFPFVLFALLSILDKVSLDAGFVGELFIDVVPSFKTTTESENLCCVKVQEASGK